MNDKSRNEFDFGNRTNDGKFYVWAKASITDLSIGLWNTKTVL